jgi:hypothetical protein
MITITSGVVPDLHLEHMGRLPLVIVIVIPPTSSRLSRVGVGDLRWGAVVQVGRPRWGVIVGHPLVGVVTMLRIVRGERRSGFPLPADTETRQSRGRRRGPHREEA